MTCRARRHADPCHVQICFPSSIVPKNSRASSRVLPLAISFFTFQQIAYLVDCYQVDTKEYDFLNYCLFVTFFPQLVAGPIVRAKDFLPQLSGEIHQRLQEAELEYLRWSSHGRAALSEQYAGMPFESASSGRSVICATALTSS